MIVSGRPCSTQRRVRAVTGFTRGETVGLIAPRVGPGPAKSSCNISGQKNRKLGGHLASVTEYNMGLSPIVECQPPPSPPPQQER